MIEVRAGDQAIRRRHTARRFRFPERPSRHHGICLNGPRLTQSSAYQRTSPAIGSETTQLLRISVKRSQWRIGYTRDGGENHAEPHENATPLQRAATLGYRSTARAARAEGRAFSAQFAAATAKYVRFDPFSRVILSLQNALRLLPIAFCARTEVENRGLPIAPHPPSDRVRQPRTSRTLLFAYEGQRRCVTHPPAVARYSPKVECLLSNI